MLVGTFLQLTEMLVGTLLQLYDMLVGTLLQLSEMLVGTFLQLTEIPKHYPYVNSLNVPVRQSIPFARRTGLMHL